jgi:hypothetical protein
MQLTDKLKSQNVVTPLRSERSQASAQSLGQVIADLSSLNHDTEQGFMSIGGKLAEFMQTVSVISSELTTLANAEHGQQAALALTQALDRSEWMRASLGERSGGLAGMRRQVGLLKRTLSGFQETVSTFHTLGLLTRIETARLGSTGVDFSDLADDVSLLAGQVDTRVESALAIADSLIPPIEDAMQEASVVQARHAKDLPALISETLASLSSFRDMQDKAHESSVRLGSQYSAISDSFKKLIVSIQFHDITRQQVEHVIEVLQRLDAESEGENHGTSRNTRGTAEVLALQSAQLADAGAKFKASVMAVESNLEGIARHVLNMVAESRALAGLNKDEKGSFFLPMEQHCRTILAGLDDTAEAEAAMQATKTGLADNIGRMRGSIQEIQHIEPKMRRMALNARISAFHLGVSGSALDVLAGSVQQLAAECRERSESLVASLGSMSDTATGSRGECEPDSADERASGSKCTDDLRLAVEELHSSAERSFAQIFQIVVRGDSFAEDLAATRMNFSVGTLFSEAVARARGTIKGIGERAPSSLQRGDGEDSDSGLADVVSHYTMQAERDVHESIIRAVTGTAHDTAPVDGQNSPTGEADELGDNVEFF